MSVNYNDTPWVLYSMEHKHSPFNKNYTRSCNSHGAESTFRAAALVAAGTATGDDAMDNYRTGVQYKSSRPANASMI